MATMPNVFELYTNNKLMDMFRSDYLIIFQDDMVLRDPMLLPNLRAVISTYGRGLGVVGCRDGFGSGYSGMCSSRFSANKLTRVTLQPGQCSVVDMLNRGPIMVGRELVNRIGTLSEDYNKSGSYSEMDYCLRAKRAGLANVCMGALIDHSHKTNPAFNQMDAANRSVFQQIWPEVSV
jgi:GT2 family glycosyltransferase